MALKGTEMINQWLHRGLKVVTTYKDVEDINCLVVIVFPVAVTSEDVVNLCKLNK